MNKSFASTVSCQVRKKHEHDPSEVEIMQIGDRGTSQPTTVQAKN